MSANNQSSLYNLRIRTTTASYGPEVETGPQSKGPQPTLSSAQKKSNSITIRDITEKEKSQLVYNLTQLPFLDRKDTDQKQI